MPSILEIASKLRRAGMLLFFTVTHLRFPCCEPSVVVRKVTTEMFTSFYSCSIKI